MTVRWPFTVALLAAVGGCAGCAAPGTPTAAGGSTGTPAAGPTAAPGGLRVLHLGDFGEQTRQQAAVAAAVSAAHARASFAVAVFAGALPSRPHS